MKLVTYLVRQNPARDSNTIFTERPNQKVRENIWRLFELLSPTSAFIIAVRSEIVEQNEIS